MLRRCVIGALCACAAVAALGCNPGHMVGKGVKKTGEKIEEASDAVQRKLE